MDVDNAFHAYSRSDTVSGDIVYVNYGRTQDFEVLNDTSSDFYVDLQDKICMAR